MLQNIIWYITKVHVILPSDTSPEFFTAKSHEIVSPGFTLRTLLPLVSKNSYLIMLRSVLAGRTGMTIKLLQPSGPHASHIAVHLILNGAEPEYVRGIWTLRAFELVVFVEEDVEFVKPGPTERFGRSSSAVSVAFDSVTPSDSQENTTLRFFIVPLPSLRRL